MEKDTPGRRARRQVRRVGRNHLFQETRRSGARAGRHAPALVSSAFEPTSGGPSLPSGFLIAVDARNDGIFTPTGDELAPSTSHAPAARPARSRPNSVRLHYRHQRRRRPRGRRPDGNEAADLEIPGPVPSDPRRRPTRPSRPRDADRPPRGSSVRPRVRTPAVRLPPVAAFRLDPSGTFPLIPGLTINKQGKASPPAGFFRQERKCAPAQGQWPGCR